MALELRSTIKSDGTLEIMLAEVPVPEPKDDQVVVRIEATPVNPSDLGLLFGAADMTTAKFSGQADGRKVTADVPEGLMKSMAGRLDQSLPVGNEAAGVVVKAGSSDMAQDWMGKTVAVIGGARYSQYRAVRVDQCVAMPEGGTPAEAASWFVNPMTAQGMVETMRMEDHGALVHTDLTGSHDVEPPEAVRIYILGGMQHALGGLPLTDTDAEGVRTQRLHHCLDDRSLLRAALVNLDRWVTSGHPAPPSRYPNISDGTAVFPETALKTLTSIPGVALPVHLRRFTRLDFGTDPGVPTKIPPVVGKLYPRSEEHTSELQSRRNLVCRLLLENKK